MHFSRHRSVPRHRCSGETDPGLNTSGRPAVKPGIEWIPAVRLEKEKELVGMYLSANPLDPFYVELTQALTPLSELENHIAEVPKYALAVWWSILKRD